MKQKLNTKIPALLCGALISMTSLASAQEPTPSSGADDACGKCEMKPGGMHHPGGDPLEMLSKRLSLSEDQKAKIKPILEEAKPQMKAAHEEAMAKMKSAMNSVHERIKPILTPDQQQKLEELRKQMENGPRSRGPGMMCGPGHGMREGNPGERLIKELNLTPDQQTQVKPIMEESRSQMRAVWEDSTLSPEQKKEKGKSIREASASKIKGLLTPEQQKKMDEIRAEHEQCWKK